MSGDKKGGGRDIKRRGREGKGGCRYEGGNKRE